MLVEKSHTAQEIMNKISAASGKVSFIDDATLSAALMYLENKGIPSNKHEDYKYCNLDAVFKKEFKNLGQNLLSVTDIKNFKIEDTITLVVINGNFSPELSDKVILKGLHLTKFSETSEQERSRISS